MSSRVPTQLISVATAAAIAATLAPAAMADTTSEFTISNITDFHGYWEQTKNAPGAAHLKCAVDRAAEGKTHIFTSAGDNIGASPFASKLLDDTPTLEILNLMNLQVSALGNHELDEGAADFSDRVTATAKFDYLAANAKTVKNTKDYVVKDLDGAKVAFIGTVTDDMPNLVNPKSIAGITWNDPVATTNELATRLKNDGEADVVVALVHEGGIKADQFSDAVDVAFLGHSHQSIEPSGEKPLLIQAGSNGTNLTDGLDGLLTGLAAIVFAAYTLIAFFQFSQNCSMVDTGACYTVRDPLDVAVICASVAGACIGFLWWNASPAKIFMGDTGSLALGGALAGVAIVTRTELLVVVIAGVFVMETISVMIQVGSFKSTGKRVFKMTPIHHHFEMLGWPEVNVVIRFWIIAVILALIGLSTLKLR